MTKPFTLVLIFGYGVFLGVEQPSAAVFGAVSLVVGGVALTSYGEEVGHRFSLAGFGCVLLSCIASAVRWGQSQKFLKSETKPEEDSTTKFDPLGMMLIVSPPACVILLPLAIWQEHEKLEHSCIMESSTADWHIALWINKVPSHGTVAFPGTLWRWLLLVLS